MQAKNVLFLRLCAKSKEDLHISKKSSTFAAMNGYWFRILTYLRHVFTARNTRGESIHSPYLFYIVDKLLSDKNSYYRWSEIERVRRKMENDTRVIHVTDYGTGGRNETGQPPRNGLRPTKTVRQIVRREVERAKVAQILFRLVNFLSEEKKEKSIRDGETDTNNTLTIIELGTSLGLTTAYLASSHKENRVITYEGSNEIADIAQQNWKQLGLQNIELVRGNIDSALPQLGDVLRAEENTLYKCARVDLAYIDANHTHEATMRYFRQILPYLHEKSIVVLDDIHHSEGMEAAWREIQSLPEVTTTMDCYHIGIVFLNKHYLKRHYKLMI